jgi:hypothetical protein
MFKYQTRPVRSIGQRQVQTADCTDKVPRVEPEDLCARCGHPRQHHCTIARKPETARFAWIHYRSEALPFSRMGYPVRCQHVAGAGYDPPQCKTSACFEINESTGVICECKSFQSPWRKVRAPKACKKSVRRLACDQAELCFEE